MKRIIIIVLAGFLFLASSCSPSTRPIRSSRPPRSPLAARPAGTRTPARPSSWSPRERSRSTTATTRRARRTDTVRAPASWMRGSATCTSPATRARHRSPLSRLTSTFRPGARNGSTRPRPATARSRGRPAEAYPGGGLRRTAAHTVCRGQADMPAGLWTDRLAQTRGPAALPTRQAPPRPGTAGAQDGAPRASILMAWLWMHAPLPMSAAS